MRSRSVEITRMIALVGCALTTAPLFAQDSTSRNANGGNGLPGDALSPFATGIAQRSAYIVDLVPLNASWGTQFGIAPIVKSGRASTARFNSVNGPCSISQTLLNNTLPASASYSLWSVPTAGVNTTDNNTALNSTLNPPTTGTSFAVGVLNYEDVTIGTTPAFLNQLVGGLVSFNPSSPNRLFVTRIVAANNSPANDLDRSQFGLGAIDASGDLSFRADGLTATSTTNVLPGDNYFRVRLASRSTSANPISSLGATDTAATSWLLNNGTVTHNVPNAIPADLAGRPVLLGCNFIGQYVKESSAGTLTTATNYRPGSTDHRGSLAFSAKQVFAGSVGTSAIISKSTGGSGKSDSISIFGVDPNGAVTTARSFILPSTLQDSCDSTLWNLAGGDFKHYDSQVTFRGGGSQIAIGKDQAGRGLAAGVVYSGVGAGGAINPYNAIAVVRFDPTQPNSTPQWTVAAWTDTASADGKDILGDFGADGVAGTADAGEGDGAINALDAPIGRLASLSELPIGRTGPSMSAPMVDSVGNIWFVSSVSVKKRMGTQIVEEFGQTLLRAVYQPLSFCYKLELVLRLGDTFVGANSAKTYQVAFLGLADTDSISSSAPWSSSMNQVAWNNINSTPIPTSDSRNLGGLVLSSRIIYDVNGDGLFEDPTAIPGNSASVDEGYNVVLYIGNTNNAPHCVADVDDGTATGQIDGGVGIEDLLYYLDNYDDGVTAADVDDGSATGVRDGGVGIEDLLYFLARYDQGC